MVKKAQVKTWPPWLNADAAVMVAAAKASVTMRRITVVMEMVEYNFGSFLESLGSTRRWGVSAYSVGLGNL